jgi:polynucleotide 5'-kinase involved in rRNA processing
MGYLTGLGELILYEILNIVQPDIVVALTTDSTTSNNTKAVMNQIQSGSY